MSIIDRVTVGGTTYDVQDSNAVRFNAAQTLTDEQKRQARENIDSARMTQEVFLFKRGQGATDPPRTAWIVTNGVATAENIDANYYYAATAFPVKPGERFRANISAKSADFNQLIWASESGGVYTVVSEVDTKSADHTNPQRNFFITAPEGATHLLYTRYATGAEGIFLLVDMPTGTISGSIAGTESDYALSEHAKDSLMMKDGQLYRATEAIAKLAELDAGNGGNITATTIEAEFSRTVIIETVSGATATITAQDNHSYICGTVTDLTITAPASGLFSVRWTAGENLVLTMNGITMPEWWTSCETGRVYELNVKDGYGVVMSWATT